MRRTARVVAAGGAVALGVVMGGCDWDQSERPARERTSPRKARPVVEALSVRVLDGDNGSPIAGARLWPLGGAKRTHELGRTDALGRAALPAAGTRAVRARATGYAPRVVRLRPGQRHVGVALYRPSIQSPQYGGGPERARYLKELSLEPPSRRPAWTFDAGSLLEFPPAVQDGVVVQPTNRGWVYALDATSGKGIWEHRQTRHSYIAASPAITGDRVLVASMDGRLVSYRLSDGHRLWEFSTGGSPIESSPLVVGDTAYVGAWNGRIYAVSAGSGRLRWTFATGAAIKGSAAAGGGLIVVGDYAGRVWGVTRSGAEAWRYAGGTRFYGGPGVSGHHVVIGDVGGAAIALDARSGRELWRHGTGSFVYSSPAIARGVAYVGSYAGRLEALDLRTGAVRWAFHAGGRISGSASVVGTTVYTSVLARRGEPDRTFGLDIRNGSVRFRMADGRYSPAVGAGRTLYLVGRTSLYAYPARP